MKLKKLLALMMAVASIAAFTAGCGGNNDADVTDSGSETTDAVTTQAGAANPGEAGFQEYPIFEDEETGFLNVSAVYFQPVPMSGAGNDNVEDFDIHLEADVSALDNDLGFGVGDWVPYMTVDYKVTGSDDVVAAEGTFMVMSASDGPHYGANIKLPNADTYTVEFTFHSPEENGYLLHIDEETGPGGTFDDYFADGNLTVTYEGWNYTPQEW